MRLFRYSFFPVLLMMAGMFVVGCQDLSVQNKNEPDRERALSEPGDLVSLLEGGFDDAFQEQVALWGVHMNGLSDQMTSTNAYLSFWDFTEQPRLRIDNSTSYATPAIINSPWSDYNAAVSSANTILQVIEQDGQQVVVNGNDRTQEMRAAAYFLRGVARGYVGMIYDKGYIVNPDTDVSNLETSSYSEIISAAEADLNQAMQVAENAQGFTFNFLPNQDSWSLPQFKEIAHSYAARFLINEARTNEEAAGWSNDRWNTILNYANKGVGGALPNFVATSVGDYQFYHAHADWETFIFPPPAGYLPNDIKQAHLLDPSYPVDYPTEGGAVLDEAESSDPRIQYFNYVGGSFGFLDPNRNRALFTSYVDLRMNGSNNWGRANLPVPFITNAEMQYIKAEANLWLGDKGAAATNLENSPFGSEALDFSINLPSVQDGKMSQDGMAAGKSIDASASQSEFIRALHTEYSIELHLLGGMGIQWFFMRRHDLLQAGTPLHYPIPGEELEITQREYYTFGGADRTGEEGTATGDNSWKTFDKRNGTQSFQSGDGQLYRAPKIMMQSEDLLKGPYASPRPKRQE